MGLQNLVTLLAGMSVTILNPHQILVTKAEDAVTGDIQLVPTSDTGLFEVQVYFGDGLNPASWVGICHDHSYYVHIVACRQLGYEPVEDSQSFTSVRSTTQIKLFDVDCRETPDANHILRCKYSVSQTGSDCQNTQTPALAIKCDFNTPLSPYDGQVILCPPQLIGVTNKRSTSFGVIGVRLHDKLLAISQPAADNGKESQPLGGSEADAICRQLGYTGVIPGSVATKSAYEHMSPSYNFNHCFFSRNTVRDLPFRYIQNASWLSTDQILKCTDLQDSQKCFGCCYNYPQDDCGDNACVTNLNDVVIRCGFDRSKIGKEVGTAGSNMTCAFNKQHEIKQCISVCADIDRKLKTVKQNYGIGISVVVLVAVSSICGICCYVIKRNKHRIKCSGYKKLTGKDQPHAPAATSANKNDTQEHTKSI